MLFDPFKEGYSLKQLTQAINAGLQTPVLH